MSTTAPLQTSGTTGRVLLVEDETSVAVLYRTILSRAGHASASASSAADARSALAAERFDVVLLDLNLPDGGGLDLLREIRSAQDAPTVIVVTADASLRTAIEGMKAGAYDYLVKPVSPDRLKSVVANALESGRLSAALRTNRPQRELDRLMGFIGASPAMQEVYRLIESAAPSEATVFITGESGTGKELAAEAIHRLSRRRNRPFVAINCAAIPADLLESEVFGHVRGAFTGAVADRAGAVQQANGGTLFLDEICEMPSGLQTKLLRFLQTGIVQPVGGTSMPADVRIVCATNRDPAREIAAGRFREDLYYRLHVIPIAMPPLRERGEDIITLARAFLAEFAEKEGRQFRTFTPEAEAAIRAYRWPGNVREMRNVLHRAVVLNDGPEVSLAMLPALTKTTPGLAPDPGPPLQRDTSDGRFDISRWTKEGDIQPLAELERAAIETAIRLCGGNVSLAAARLRVAASTLYRKRSSWES